MANFASPASIAEARQPEPVRALNISAPQSMQIPAGGPAAEAAEKLRNQEIVSRKNELIPGNLLVRLDEDAGRFVQTLMDAVTEETKWRYPSDAQLAFSRAVNAYLRTMCGW
jgi:hypothetical protein